MELPMTVRVQVLAAASTVPSSYYQSNLVPMRHCCKIPCITLGQIGPLSLACWISGSTDTVASWCLKKWKTTLMKSLSMHTSFAGFYDEHIATSLVNFSITQVVELHGGWVVSGRSHKMICKPSHNESAFCFKCRQSPHHRHSVVPNPLWPAAVSSGLVSRLG